MCDDPRILLYTSPMPLVTVFTHAIASHDQRDILLLERVLQTLEAVKHVSKSGERLYQICKVFLQVALVFMASVQAPLDSFDEEDNSFSFPHPTGGLFDFQQGGEINTNSMNDDLAEEQAELYGMSTILGTWLGDDQSVKEIFNMDLPHFRFS